MSYKKYYQKATNYFKKHEMYNATVHAVGGIGVGILLASPLFHPHPVRWAIVFMSLSVAGHIYAFIAKK